MMQQGHKGARELQGSDFAWQEGETPRSNCNSHAMEGTWKRIDGDQIWVGEVRGRQEGKKMYFLFISESKMNLYETITSYLLSSGWNYIIPQCIVGFLFFIYILKEQNILSRGIILVPLLMKLLNLKFTKDFRIHENSFFETF